MIELDAERALIAYSGLLTGAVIWLAVSAAAPSPRHVILGVERVAPDNRAGPPPGRQEARN